MWEGTTKSTLTTPSLPPPSTTATPSVPPPSTTATPSVPPPSTTATPSIPPPSTTATPSVPPPSTTATPSVPPPSTTATPSVPPPSTTATPSVPPPSTTATPSVPPPSTTATPSVPPPSTTATPSVPPPSTTATPSVPPPSTTATPSVPPPSTTATPSVPPPSTTATPSVPPPSTTATPSVPPPSTTISPPTPTFTAETPPTSATSPVVSTVTGGTTTLKITSPSFSPPSSTAATTLSLTATTLSSTISITPTPSPSTAVTPCIKKTLSSATQDNLSVGPGDDVYDSLAGSGNTFIGDTQGGLNNLVYRILAEGDTAEIYEVQLTTKNVKKITVSVYDNNGLNVKTTSQDIVDGSVPSLTTFNFNGTVGITVEISVLAEPNTFAEVSGVEIKACYTPAIPTTTTPSTVPTTSTAPTTPCQDQMLDRLTPQMFNITSTSGEEPPSQALEPTGLTFKPEDENPRVTAVLDTPDDVPITSVTVTLDNVENATIVIVNSDGDIVEQFEVTPTTPGQPEEFSVQPTEPGTTIQIIPVPIPSLPPPVVSELSVKACVHIPSTTPFPSTTVRSTTAATTVTPCVSKMISISENPNAVKFPQPSSTDPSTAPADVLSQSGWKPASNDDTPVLTAELQDEDDVASVKKVQVDVQNVQSINAVLKDKNGDVVEEIENNPVNGVVTFDFGSKEGLTIEFQITPVAGQQPVVSNLEIEACIEIRVSTVTTISVTMTTTTPHIIHECILTPEAFEEQFGYYPPNQIGYIEKDGIPGLTSTDEEVSIGDSIEEGIVVIIQCSNCTCMREGIMCNIGPCENCTYTDWESWSECSKDCDVGQRERTRTLLSNPVNTICSEETKQTEDCNIQPCATTTPSCTPWSQWSGCSASGCDVGSRHRSRDCFGNGQNTYDTEPCYSDDPSCLSTTPVCTDGKVWMDCSSPNISFCPIDCRGYRMSTECTEPDACQPACYCPSGQVENEEGVCIDVEDCPCYSESGEIVVEGATWIPDGKKCEVCKCEYGVTKCDPVDDCCDWSDWGPWGSCSQTCDEGTQNRYRTLKNGDAATCGSDQESQTCDNPESLECVDCIHNGVTYQVSQIIPDMGTKCQECYCTSNNEINCLNSTNKIQNGNWASWNEWSECTLNCTGGTRHRTRTCSDPLPECGGSPCPGDNSETEPCNQDVSCCTVSQWETWTTCSQTCDGGKQFRIRHYEDPNDAVACNETVKEERDCNTDPCITTCNITNWTDWTPCDVPCGFGTVTRERSIIGEIVADCPDNLSESDTCYAGDCPCADNQKWSNGTECRRTCANRYDALGYCNDVGCICENGYYFDNNGDCVNETICGICTVNGVNYTSGETFTNPENQCEICECVDGELQCTRTCSIPTCKEDEELSYNPEDTPDPCCPVCKPKPKDTCTLHTVDKVLQADNGCISNETITFTYCAGGCGNSTYEPVIRMDGEAYPSFKSDCKCCTGTPGGTKEFDLICPGGGVQKAQISILTQCSCDICVDSADTPPVRRR